MKNFNKILSILALGLITSGSAVAATSNANLMLTATVIDGCVFKQASYAANVGAIPVGQVGKAHVTYNMVCTDSIPYSIAPTVDSVTITGGSEDAIVTIYSDAARTTQIKGATPLSNPGGTIETSGTIYVRVNGTPGKPNFGEGPVLTNPQSLSATVPIVVSF